MTPVVISNPGLLRLVITGDCHLIFICPTFSATIYGDRFANVGTIRK